MEPVSNKKVSLCYQCAKCSAGCPVAEQMDIPPHLLMHLMSLGREDRCLAANTIWMCASCFTCATRCPNGIDITSVMDDLRSKAVKNNIPPSKPDVLTFHRAFIGDIARRGRVHELRLMGEYNIRSGKPFHNASIAPKMFFGGRLKILPPRALKGFKKWLRKLWTE